MKILLVSPCFPINPTVSYAGIERLVHYFAGELVKSHDVTVLGHAESVYPEGVKLLGYKPTDIDKTVFMGDELGMYSTHQSVLREFDVIHDFSHGHLASRFNPNLPSLNIFWHAPSLAKYDKSPYNIIALSQWAKREFKRVYRQESVYMRSACIDTLLYKPSKRHRNDRFLAIGRMGVDKGNLNAVLLCKRAGVPLDIIAAPCGEPQYEQQVRSLCDGEQIRLLGDISEAEKIKVMQSNKALIYATNHPEVTSHKDQECVCCGMPAIVSNIGAASEIITQGVNGYLCNTDEDFIKALKCIEPVKHLDEFRNTWSISSIVGAYAPLYEHVAEGMRW